MPAGRPTDYSEELATIICAGIAEGKSLNKICKEDSMPCMLSVYRWLFKYPEFSKNYTKAREDQAETLADDIVEISDNGTNDWMEINDPDNPGYRVNGEAIARSRLRVDARKWIASKLKPKKYGERQEVEHTLNGDLVDLLAKARTRINES